MHMWLHDIFVLVKPKFHLARLDTTQHVRRVEPMHFGCVDIVEHHSSMRLTSSSESIDSLDKVELDWLNLQLKSYRCCEFISCVVGNLI